jgi:hypothetical protein
VPVVCYSGSETKAHPFTGVDEADNWDSLQVRSHSWIFHAEMLTVYTLNRPNTTAHAEVDVKACQPYV